MPRKEIEGDWVYGWPDRKRHQHAASMDPEGRVIHARTPFLELEGLITPTDASFVIAQLEMPEPVHPDDYSFEVTGEVNNAGSYTFDELRRFPGHTVRAVAECAGNDTEYWDYLKSRAEGGNVPKPTYELEDGAGMAWRGKADQSNFDMDQVANLNPSTCFMSGGEWTGIPLRELLNAAGLKDTAVAVRIEGFDEGRPDPTVQYLSVGNADFEVFDPGVINYDKGLAIEKAMDPDTILAWAHNGEWLTHVHGAPMRLVVPGWAGNWWVKWINKIEIMDHMPDCYHQTHYFVSGKSPDDPDKKPMTALGVKTMITEPRDDESPLDCGTHVIRGLAWSGEGAMVRVEVSTDSGETWQDAHIEAHKDRYLWRRFSFVWHVNKPGDYCLLSRGTDEKGRCQPVTEWNFQRKHFDGLIPIDITIK
jgi:DMSO/TMAO reductase YedYZ molybdopterin-dependent catalytic subunit